MTEPTRPPSWRRAYALLAWILVSLALTRQAEELTGQEPTSKPSVLPYDAALVTKVIAEAKGHGDPRKGAAVFGSPQFACLSCHKIGSQGGSVGPDLSKVGLCLTPE